jgi:hypothetical protein
MSAPAGPGALVVNRSGDMRLAIDVPLMKPVPPPSVEDLITLPGA